VITASGSVAGNIVIAAPNTDISSSLVVLPETFVTPAASCAWRVPPAVAAPPVHLQRVGTAVYHQTPAHR